MRRVVASLVLVMAFLTPSTAAAQDFPFCQPGQTPEFRFGFAALADALGDTMGTPIECEHSNPENGDTLQYTSTGLAFYRKSTNTPTFTTGIDHWALTPQGIIYWVGASIDPPLSRVQTLDHEQSGSALCGPFQVQWSSPAPDDPPPAEARIQATDANGALVLDVAETTEFSSPLLWPIWCGNVLADGSTVLAYLTYSGGAHCCFTAHVVLLGAPAGERLLVADLGNAASLDPQQLDDDPPLELVGRSDALAYFDSLPYAVTHFLPLAYDFNGQRYRESTRQHPDLIRAHLADELRTLDETLQRDPETVYFEELAAAALAVYSDYALLGEANAGLADVKARVPSDVDTWLDQYLPEANQLLQDRFAAP